MILKPRNYVCGMRVKTLALKIPSCFGLIKELQKKRVNCRCRCDLRTFCKKVSIQFKGELK